jgi:HD-like signal output (HDOD) protein
MADNLIDRALEAEVVATFGDPAYRPPPLPSVAIQLVGLSQRDDADIAQVVRLLEQDQVLAGIVMRLVSSPIYAGRSAITTLSQAIVRIGLKRLRSVVFEAALRGEIFDMPEYREVAEQISRHGLATAYLARLVCQEAGVDAEHGFLCGLLHDVGFSALLQSVTRQARGARPRLDAIWPNVDDLHPRASGVVARLWSLPTDLTEAIAHHHHPRACAEGIESAAAVCIADRLAESFGAAIVGTAATSADGQAAHDRTRDEDLAEAREALHLSDTRMAKILERAHEVVPAVLGSMAR